MKSKTLNKLKKNFTAIFFTILTVSLIILFTLHIVFPIPYANELWVNLKSPDEIEGMTLCPVIGAVLTIPKSFIIKDRQIIAKIYNCMRGNLKRQDFPSGFAEHWTSWQEFKIFISLKDGRKTAFLIDFNDSRDLTGYSQFVDPNAIRSNSSSRGTGFETSKKLYDLVNNIITKNNINWVNSSRDFWEIKDKNIKYIGPPARTAKNWGRGKGWKPWIKEYYSTP